MQDEFHFAILPLNPFPDKPSTPSPEMQQATLDDIQHQFVTYMSRAVAERDAFKALRLIANCERICDVYTASGRHNMLAKFQQELQSDLHKVWRMARRQFIKRALLSPPDEFQLYLADMRNPELHLDDCDALADFHAVERHLDERQPLFADLHKRAATN